MGSVNRALICGHLGAKPEVKYTQAGKAVCNLSVATSEVWKDKSGQKQDRTEWHKIVCYGDNAENCGKYLDKGRLVFVEGRIQTRKWQDQSGADRYTTEIVADRVTFLGGSGEGKSEVQASSRRVTGEQGELPSVGGLRPASTPTASELPPQSDEDIPF